MSAERHGPRPTGLPEALLLTGQAAAGAAMLLLAAGFFGPTLTGLLPGPALTAGGVAHEVGLVAATHGAQETAPVWAGRAWLTVPLAAGAVAWAWPRAAGPRGPERRVLDPETVREGR